ncbi:hypothetical protein T440DRAFT_262649 [Plenodomus tracheiphilus IPT5]|uniref:Uncharacterized protein n=1 Tax=Plenodomus tracheiphilus IPT5 TaxID=1408161 RepID=A0A6A7ATS2_9PLEO|nr:hypothetical protein T440DRAFT_262649 [Plenodomus tracheiphilus IPT5]
MHIAYFTWRTFVCVHWQLQSTLGEVDGWIDGWMGRGLPWSLVPRPSPLAPRRYRWPFAGLSLAFRWPFAGLSLPAILVGRHQMGARARIKERQTAAGVAGQQCFESGRARVSHTATRPQPIWRTLADCPRTATRSTGAVPRVRGGSIAKRAPSPAMLRGRSSARGLRPDGAGDVHRGRREGPV